MRRPGTLGPGLGARAGFVVEAIMQKNREHVYHAALLDPHTAAVLDIDQTYAMVDELLAAHADSLPDYLKP